MSNQTIRIAEILKNLNLSNVNIPYDSYSLTKLKLNTTTTTRTIKYGFLGDDITFLLLKITYDDQNPFSIIEENQNIEYWFEDEPTIIRKAHKLLLFTGNSTHRIPQIYLKNTSGLKVDIDILMANLSQSDIDILTFPNKIITYSGLYYNSIRSNTYWNATANVSGSSQFEIYDLDDVRLLSLPYLDLPTFNLSGKKITIILTGTTYILDFVNEFEMYQANSRMLWVMEEEYIRYLSKTNPTLDIIEPTFILNNNITPLDLTGNTYIYQYITGTTIIKDDILFHFISGIIDNRDGIINISGCTVEIYDSNMVSLTGITESGDYNIIIYIKDNANNIILVNYILKVGAYVIIVENETYILPTENTELSVIYSGSENTTSNLVISGTTIIISNSGGSFVWDLGGIDQHIFTYIGETIIVTISSINYTITWNGYGSLVFNLKMITDWLLSSGYWDSSKIWDSDEYWISA